MTDSEESFPEKEEKQNGLERVLECFPEMSWYHFGVGCKSSSHIWKNEKIDVLFLDFKIRKKNHFSIFYNQNLYFMVLTVRYSSFNVHRNQSIKFVRNLKTLKFIKSKK